MGKIIQLCEETPVDPVIRKGDLVRIIESEDDFVGASGIVTEVIQRYAEDADAQGQAAIMEVAIPTTDGEQWDLLTVMLNQIHRVLSAESKQLRGYEV